MTAPTDPQIVIRSGDLQLVEKDLAHVGVEVLAGVDDYLVTEGRPRG